MSAWWAHLSWSRAALDILLVLLVIGYVITDSVENPRAWRFLRAVRRVLRRYFRSWHPVQATRWDGAIVRAIPATGWAWHEAIVGASQRSWRVITAPWRWLCARIAARRLRKLRAPAAPKTSWAPVDYSAKRAKALEQLGPDYLLHTPVDRITRSGA